MNLITTLLAMITAKTLIYGGFGVGTGLIVLESVGRRKFPESVFRPSNGIDHLTDLSVRAWTWAGFQFARCTDLYYILQEYFPYEDIRRLGGSTAHLVVSPFKALKGYHDYYTSGMTPLQYGIVSSAIVVAALGLGIRYYWRPEFNTMFYNGFHNLRGRFIGGR